ncbi:unnamed protein product [Pedinophyceae sp. YPF-701]|nr:unnamed protein product [Pedinophyceae sp. YPF-701]
MQSDLVTRSDTSGVGRRLAVDCLARRPPALVEVELRAVGRRGGDRPGGRSAMVSGLRPVRARHVLRSAPEVIDELVCRARVACNATCVAPTDCTGRGEGATAALSRAWVPRAWCASPGAVREPDSNDSDSTSALGLIRDVALAATRAAGRRRDWGPLLPNSSGFAPPGRFRALRSHHDCPPDRYHVGGARFTRVRQLHSSCGSHTSRTAAQPRSLREEILNVPNAISVARLLSSPLIFSLIVQERWDVALPALALSGASDWADGFAARKLNQESVLGTYLDPVADKALVGATVAALYAQGSLPLPTVGIILFRDVYLIGGSLLARAKHLQGHRLTPRTFFQLAPGPSHGQASAPAIEPVRPTLLSKANTCLQLALAGAAITGQAYGVPPAEAIGALQVATVATTVGSLAQYHRRFARVWGRPLG